MTSLPLSTSTAQEIGDLPFHPLANVFPLIEGDEFDALVADIEANGLRDKITLYEGKILDGRNRHRAALAAGVALTQDHVRLFVGDDPLGFVVSVNLRRRHLDDSQRAMIAADIANMRRGGDRRSDQSSILSNDISQTKAAETLNVSRTYVQSAKAVLASGDAELIAAVKAGQTSVHKAAETVRRAAEDTRPAPPRQPAPFSGGVMLRMRNDAASLKGADLAQLIAEWIMARVEVSVMIGSRADIMAQLGGGEAARASISAWVKGDVLDSQRASLVKETIAAMKHDAERNKLIEELGGGVAKPALAYTERI